MLGFALAGLRLAALGAIVSAPLAASDRGGLTAVDGVRVGSHTLTARPTGCTVVLVEEGAVGGVDVRGAAPATRETDLLDPVNTVQVVHAIVLSGGSAFGLDTATGVMRYLEERGKGFAVGASRVPIVPAAAIFDLTVGDGRIRPDATCGYEAARAATTARPTEGSVGVGAGATVGKLLGMGRAMKGGLGSAEIRTGDLVVAALIAVNAVGDVVDPATGRVVAGARGEDGRTLVDARVLLRSGLGAEPPARANTTIGVIATNARLTKTDANRVAQVAHDGLARSIAPAHTPGDGDTLFVLATGAIDAPSLLVVGELAAQAVAEAVLRAVREATGVEGYPAVRDLAPSAAPE
ncbi:MAG TPA: P1 family peptidase [Thermoanaerobaculia bacterium]|jgi:L-aminopeptidase/D-esterase-like protein|nr:P1 family peptidase [Thermoanaerobaculia bacterium]